MFENLFPENLYHSYIIEGDPQIVPKVLKNFLEQRGELTQNSPDLFLQNYEALTIDDSYPIKEWHSKKEISGRKKICILGVKFINHEAERTLLKILEEPGENTHFFLVIPQANLLLDTIRSRAHLIKIEDKSSANEKIARDFLALTKGERINLIGKMIKDNKEDEEAEGSGKLRYEAINLVNSLEKIIYQDFKSERGGENNIFILEELQKARDYLSTSGASVKMILEHLALVI